MSLSWNDCEETALSSSYSNLSRQIKISAVLVPCVFLIGTLGYWMIENAYGTDRWTLSEALYMTVITVATVGFSEVHPLSEPGRWFSILLILCGIGVIGYGFSALVAFLVEGEIHEAMRRRMMEKNLSKMHGHVILCGGGRSGAQAAAEFHANKTPFVIIDSSPENAQELRNIAPDVIVIEEDATQDEALIHAGIFRAKALLTCLSDDRDNLFVTLSARDLRPDLLIISRASEDAAAHKMLKAGADKVVAPATIGGMRMASMVIRPSVVSFLDVMMKGVDVVIRLEEAEVPEGSILIGKRLQDAMIPQKTGLHIIAIKNASTGKFLVNPNSSTILGSGDSLIAIGTPEQLDGLRKHLAHPDLG